MRLGWACVICITWTLTGTWINNCGPNMQWAELSNEKNEPPIRATTRENLTQIMLSEVFQLGRAALRRIPFK
jgi:hypothetical protein